MNYRDSSAKMNSELNSFHIDILNMNCVSFDEWTGSAKDSYLGSYKSNMSDLENEFNKIGVFSELLAQVDVYNGTQDTYRPWFDKRIDRNTFQRPF